MRSLDEREKRTVKIAVGFLAVYLLGFGGIKAWRQLESLRARASELAIEIDALESSARLEDAKRDKVERLERELGIDLRRLDATTVVGESLGAIRGAATARQVRIDHQKEIQDAAGSRDLARFQLRGGGSVDAVTRFLDDVNGLGLPLLIESVDLHTGKTPGDVILSVTITLLNQNRTYEAGASDA